MARTSGTGHSTGRERVAARSVVVACGLACLMGWAGAASAQVHAGDIVLTVPGNRITTNAASGVVFTPDRVFSGDLNFFGQPFSDSPGFDCVPGTFASGTRIGFRIHDALRQWDGQDFDAIAPVVMDIEFAGGALRRTTPDTAGTLVDGYVLNVSSNGQWHRHYDFLLRDPATNQYTAPPGLYLLELSLFTQSGSPSESETFWIVFDFLAPTGQLSQAVEWVRTNLIAPPGPACDSLDFNQDGDFPTPLDLEDFINAVAGNPCATCASDLDFNNDGDFPTPLDIEAFISVSAGGPCL